MTRHVELYIKEIGIRFNEKVKNIHKDLKILADQEIQQELY